MKLLQKDLRVKKIGFKSTEDRLNQSKQHIKEEDIIEYGFIPEFVGRAPIIIQLNPLTPEIVRKIILARIHETSILFGLKNINLTINGKYLDSLVDLVMNSSTGARSVHSIIYKLFYPALYRIFQSKGNGLCRITDAGKTELLITSPDLKTPILYTFDNEIDKENSSELEQE